MTTNNIQTTAGIGDSETAQSASFLARPRFGDCADPQKISQWAELKSSFLTQAIISNDNIELPLVAFLKNIITNF
jgi:hypothetical protein